MSLCVDSVVSQPKQAMNSQCIRVAIVTEDGEEFLEHDPFIVRHNDLYSEEFLITVTSEKIIEKNIEGVITEMLDLSALRDVQSVEVVRHATVELYYVLS